MSVVTVFVTSHNASSERRFDKATTLGELKQRLEPITGIPASTIRLSLYDDNDQFVGPMAGDDDRMLGYFPVADYWRIQCTPGATAAATGPGGSVLAAHHATGAAAAFIPDYNDVSGVEKFEISDAEYASRNDSVRAFKQRHKLGRFAETDPSSDAAQLQTQQLAAWALAAEKITVGNRCELLPAQDSDSDLEPRKRGTVAFIGTTEFKPGVWVGVTLDEPTGKNDGAVDGIRYFQCPAKRGVFVRPTKVAVGDYPERDLFDELDEL
ncbi:hypothetical protein CXG81DRAFT_26234 [Caulochytrium protostelioides]|uniref:CAP-Gly domain-containing protein n=1 Tax=Caulochytrium protostelioides TaxID=1555241 RepID=A0A4V1IUM6_9FUNG|nr:hypothetical protein CXG81DRAFT_26234 [Caulochytrium protostelioides]|eukprot:RKP01089.1 hypothetical protein CXG81DRAFT_26234 [Caulochytrium protostelioides]